MSKQKRKSNRKKKDSVFQRPGSSKWQYDFIFKGERFRGSSSTDSKELAEAFVAKLKSEVYQGKQLKRKHHINFDEALGRYWLEYAQHLKSGKGAVRYRLEHFKRIFGSNINLSDIDDNKVARYIAQRKSEYVPNTIKKLSKVDLNNPPAPPRHISNRTILHELKTLNSLNNRAKDIWNVEGAEINLKKHKSSLPVRDPLINFISESKQHIFIDLLPEYLKAPAMFYLMTGVRYSNIQNLKWEDVDWENEVIHFRIKSNTPDGKPHKVILVEKIRRLLTYVGIKETGYVFTYEGRQLGSHRKALYTAYKKAGIRRVMGQGTHLMRHTAVTNQIAHSKDPVAVQHNVGHANISTTMIYTHVLEENKRKALEGGFSPNIPHSDEKEGGK